MAPRAAMSADGKSLLGNELSPHLKGTSLSLCYLETYACTPAAPLPAATAAAAAAAAQASTVCVGGSVSMCV